MASSSRKSSKKEAKPKKSSKEAKHKSEKKSRRDSKQKKSSKEHKEKKEKVEKKGKKEKKDKKDKRDKKDTRASSASAPSTAISADDYFLRSIDFRVWCKLFRKTPFESLDSDKAREIFAAEFVKDYNKGRLPDMFYTEIPAEIREATLKTQHQWNIKVSKSEKETVSNISEDVQYQTDHVARDAWEHMKKADASSNGSGRPQFCQPVSSSSAGGGRSLDARRLADDDKRDDQRNHAKYEAKKYREYTRDVMDDVAPKETGRDALRDKRKGEAVVLHAAAREREEGRDGLDLSESFTMGGGDDFQSMKARMSAGRNRREEAKEQRLQELQMKDKQRSEDFMSQLGVDLSKGPIRIAPRKE
jgi:hypothetical protein